MNGDPVPSPDTVYSRSLIDGDWMMDSVVMMFDRHFLGSRESVYSLKLLQASSSKLPADASDSKRPSNEEIRTKAGQLSLRPFSLSSHSTDGRSIHPTTANFWQSFADLLQSKEIKAAHLANLLRRSDAERVIPRSADQPTAECSAVLHDVETHFVEGIYLLTLYHAHQVGGNKCFAQMFLIRIRGGG